METFEEKMEVFSDLFHDALIKFDEETKLCLLEIIAGQLCFADEFSKASANIEVAC